MPDVVAIGDPLANCPVDEAHAVRGIRIAPVAIDRLGEPFAVADRAFGIR